jgi:hypothetical protein
MQKGRKAIAEREATEEARRTIACAEACRGLPTDALEKIGKLRPTARPAALAKLAMRWRRTGVDTIGSGWRRR